MYWLDILIRVFTFFSITPHIFFFLLTELNTLFDVERDILKPVDPPVNCKDDVSNCQRINRQRLCKLHYYKTYCCATCSGYA